MVYEENTGEKWWFILHMCIQTRHTHTHIKIDKIINIANLWSGIIFLLVGVSISYLLCPHRRYTAVRAAQHQANSIVGFVFGLTIGIIRRILLHCVSSLDRSNRATHIQSLTQFFFVDSFTAWSVHLCYVLMNKLIKRKQSIKSVCVWCQCMWTVKVIKSTNIIEHRSERTFQKERIAIQQTTQISIWKSKRHICESRV